MTFNKISLHPNRRAANIIKQANRDIRGLKTPQKSGADVLPLAIASLTSFGPFVLAPNAFRNLFFRVVPHSPLLTLWDFMFTIYVDSDTAPYAWPYGTALSSGQQMARVTGNRDYLNFDQTTNTQAFLIRIENYDTSTHSYFVDFLTATPEAS